MITRRAGIGALAVVMSASAHGKTLYWDINGATVGASAGTTATGTWDTSAVWNGAPDGASTTESWSTGSRAVFAAGSNATGTYTVTVVGTQNTTGLDFNLGNVTLTGGTIQENGGSFTVSTALGASGTIASVITGSGGLTKSGAGTLTLTGTNTYTGTNTISAGTLSIGNGGTTGSVVGNIATSASLVFNRSNAYTYAGVISGSGTVLKLGAGTLTLSNTNTYTGGTTISDGVISISANAGLGNASGGVTLGGGTLQVTTSFTVARALTLSTGGGSLDVGSGLTLTWNGNISGAANRTLTKTGAGKLTLGGTNTYVGPTVVAAGTLSAGLSGTLSASSAMTVQTGAVLDLAGFSQSVGSLAGGGDVTLGGGDFTVGGDDSSTTFSGTIAGTGMLTKTGAGTFTLSGTNTSSGSTVVSSGTLALGAANRLADTSNLTLSGGTLALAGFGETVNTLSLTSNSIIDFGAGNAALIFANSSGLSWTGTLTIMNFNPGTDSLRFGVDGTGLTAAQLSSLRFADFGNAAGQIDSSGYVTAAAVPEPSLFSLLAATIPITMVGFRRWARVRKLE